jgi:hypothetical protein
VQRAWGIGRRGQRVREGKGRGGGRKNRITGEANRRGMCRNGRVATMGRRIGNLVRMREERGDNVARERMRTE